MKARNSDLKEEQIAHGRGDCPKRLVDAEAANYYRNVGLKNLRIRPCVLVVRLLPERSQFQFLDANIIIQKSCYFFEK